MGFKLGPLPLVAALAVVAAAQTARAEASHHQGAAGQVANAVSTAQLQSLTSSSAPEEWRLTLFPSYLRATSAFDDGGTSASLPAGSRVENYTLNAYAERRLGERWAVSALTGWQELRLSESGVARSVSSLGDSFLALRRSDAMGWGALSATATIKIPGTYPESALTSVKQVDAQLEVLASTRPLAWLSLAAGSGYRLRLGGVQDEVTATVLATLDLGAQLTLAPTLLAAVPVGLGTIAKNAVTAGAALGWRATPAVSVMTGYYRTVYGRNVVQADVATVGATAAF